MTIRTGEFAPMEDIHITVDVPLLLAQHSLRQLCGRWLGDVFFDTTRLPAELAVDPGPAQWV